MEKGIFQKKKMNKNVELEIVSENGVRWRCNFKHRHKPKFNAFVNYGHKRKKERSNETKIEVDEKNSEHVKQENPMEF